MSQHTIDIYNLGGEKVETIPLSDAVFGVKVSKALLHTTLTRQLNNAHLALAHTKTRAERRGGGRKPFAQKHTGNARAGTRRSPLWRKGGVIFGPRGTENHTRRLPHKARVKALLGTLNVKAESQQILGLVGSEGLEPKTSQLAATLKKLPLKRSTLIVTLAPHKIMQLAARNLPSVKVIQASYLNLADLLKFQSLIFLKESLPKLDELWGTVMTKSNRKTAPLVPAAKAGPKSSMIKMKKD